MPAAPVRRSRNTAPTAPTAPKPIQYDLTDKATPSDIRSRSDGPHPQNGTNVKYTRQNMPFDP